MPPWREQAPGPPALIEPSLQDTTVRLALNAASALFVELAALAALDLIYAALASAISFADLADCSFARSAALSRPFSAVLAALAFTSSPPCPEHAPRPTAAELDPSLQILAVA